VDYATRFGLRWAEIRRVRCEAEGVADAKLAERLVIELSNGELTVRAEHDAGSTSPLDLALIPSFWGSIETFTA
jgi:hypothetical protein